MPPRFFAAVGETDRSAKLPHNEMPAIDGGCVFTQVGQALLGALVTQFQQPSSDVRCMSWTRLEYGC